MRNLVKTTSMIGTCFVLSAAAYLTAAAGFGSSAKPNVSSEGFLHSTAAVIRIGIWDRDGIAEKDEATFIVTGPDKKQYKAVVKKPLSGDDVHVDFPDDFTPLADSRTPGIYAWKCLVDGQEAAADKFKWKTGLAVDNNDSSIK